MSRAIKATDGCFRRLPAFVQVGSQGSSRPAAHIAEQSPSAASLRPSSNVAMPHLRKTGLYDLHVHHGASMVAFGGYLMPVRYGDMTIGESHRWTREKASLFDVGHMYVGCAPTLHTQ